VNSRWLAAAGVLIVVFMCGEVAAGLVAHSLARLQLPYATIVRFVTKFS
jgi:hypothetical protein